MRKIICLGCISFLMITGCGGSTTNSGGASSSSTVQSGLYLATNSAKSTPQINGSLSGSVSPFLSLKDGEGSSSALSQIGDFFKLECHDDAGTLNFCPSGVDSTSLNTKFTTTTLIGLIQHADMYLGNIYTTENIVDPETGESTEVANYKTCERGTTHATLTDNTPVYSPTTANSFILDFGTLFDCVGTLTFVSKTDYVLYSKATDNLHFAGLTSRKEESGSIGGVSYQPSDIFQSYVRRSETGDPVVLGFNLAAYSNYPSGGGDNSGQRALLITNMSSNRFIVKYVMGLPESESYADGYEYVVALGTAGYNPSSGTWVTGNYLVKSKFHDDDTMMTCVQNGETPTVLSGPTSTSSWVAPSEDESCGDVGGFFSETGWTFGEVLEWLSATADSTNLSSFESFFDDSEFLGTGATVVPHDGTTYFPDSISN